MKIYSIEQALANAKGNKHREWNRSPSSSVLSDHDSDAARRVFDDFADVIPAYTGPRLQASDAVFAMGSCFAREIERALIAAGGNVVSIDDTIQREEFFDADGAVRDGFFHRFTPRAMYQEFAAAFDELPGWDESSLIFPWGSGTGGGGRDLLDLNYWNVRGASNSPDVTRTRRRVAQQLVRNAARAKVVILTLGLVEAWRHRPTGLFANRAHPTLFNRYKDQFEFVKLDYVDTLECLEGMRGIIAKHAAHPVQFVVTVSPVPLAATFTDEDVVIANTYSKSTLRAAASDFVDKHADVHYFPSYEIVLNTERGLAWRPDRIHVQRDTVRYIVNKFVGQYYEPDALTLV